MDRGAWWAAVHGVAKSQTRLSNFTFTFHFHALEKEMATHSSVPAWRIPRTGEPGGLPSMGLHRVRHDWSDLAAAAAVSPTMQPPHHPPPTAGFTHFCRQGIAQKPRPHYVWRPCAETLYLPCRSTPHWLPTANLQAPTGSSARLLFRAPGPCRLWLNLVNGEAWPEVGGRESSKCELFLLLAPSLWRDLGLICPLAKVHYFSQQDLLFTILSPLGFLLLL